MTNNKKGFTLIELLAVIVILAIILLIAVPSIMGVVKTAKENTFNNQVGLIRDAATNYILKGDAGFDENKIITLMLKDVQNSGLMPDEISDPRCKDGRFNNYLTTIDITKSANGKITYVVNPITSCTVNNLESPVFVIDPSTDNWVKSRKLTITYSSHSTSNKYTNSYSMDDGLTWVTVTGIMTEITVNQNGNVLAKTSDGNHDNDQISSFMVAKTDGIPPTTPTSGAIGDLTGTDTTGTIQTPASGSTDISNITYKYLVTTTSEEPSNTDSRFNIYEKCRSNILWLGYCGR